MTKVKNIATDLFNDFAVNEVLSQDGVWVSYVGDVEFLIARAGNKQYRKVAQALYKKNARILDGANEAATEKLTEIVVEAMARGILLGWRGNVQFKGEALPYSYENAKMLLQMERLRDFIDAAAKDEAQFAAMQEAEAEKN
jgi:hypothetical protein